AYERIVLLEEPFPEEVKVRVGGFGVRVAADESAHSIRDVEERIALGYGAIALKPAAKTFSLTLRMAAATHAAGVPCFCADLTVSPLLVDWNKSVAARLAPLPGLELPAFETNGAQHYARWAELQSFHPRAGASWTLERSGGFDLDESFYASGGGILDPVPHSLDLLTRGP
ncbi:MAG: L-alanine-DL-glutamate epimerase, partial [bacterium]